MWYTRRGDPCGLPKDFSGGLLGLRRRTRPLQVEAEQKGPETISKEMRELLGEKGQSNLVARAANENDFSAIVEMWKRFMTEEKEAVDEVDPGKEVSKWSWRLRKQIEEEKALVVERNNEILGFACFVGRAREGDYKRGAGNDSVLPGGPEMERPAPEQVKRLPILAGVAYVTDLYVSPEGRRSRAAQSLFAALFEAVAAAGFTAVWTNTSSRNRRVQTLLQRLGFSVMPGFRIRGMENHVYYERKLRT